MRIFKFHICSDTKKIQVIIKKVSPYTFPLLHYSIMIHNNMYKLRNINKNK